MKTKMSNLKWEIGVKPTEQIRSIENSFIAADDL
jgi:hypothetical protein